GPGHLRTQRGRPCRAGGGLAVRRQHADAEHPGGHGHGTGGHTHHGRGPATGTGVQRPDEGPGGPPRPARVHRTQPQLPRRPDGRVPERPAGAADRRRMGPVELPARLDLQLRARTHPGIGARTRVPRPAHRVRCEPERDRDRLPASPGRHAECLPGPRTSRTASRSLRLLTNLEDAMTATTPAGHHTPENLPEHIQHYIDGEFVDSADGATFDVLDPVTNQNYLKAAAGKKADIDRAVTAARRAFTEGPWPHMLPRERSRVLHRIADIVESRGAQLAELECFDTGLPISQAQSQGRRAAENFRFFADLIVAQHDNAFKVPQRQINYVNRKPIGVAGLITPWNTPFMLESWKLAPAIATGNTVVLKPAEFTPLSASLWAGIFEEAGLPRGVFNLVNGFGEDAGDALVKHPDVPL